MLSLPLPVDCILVFTGCDVFLPLLVSIELLGTKGAHVLTPGVNLLRVLLRVLLTQCGQVIVAKCLIKSLMLLIERK